VLGYYLNPNKGAALEFIAHYLDRIDDHLEALAVQARAGTAESAKMAMALQSVTQLLGRIASNP